MGAPTPGRSLGGSGASGGKMKHRFKRPAGASIGKLATCIAKRLAVRFLRHFKRFIAILNWGGSGPGCGQGSFGVRKVIVFASTNQADGGDGKPGSARYGRVIESGLPQRENSRFSGGVYRLISRGCSPILRLSEVGEPEAQARDFASEGVFPVFGRRNRNPQLRVHMFEFFKALLRASVCCHGGSPVVGNFK